MSRARERPCLTPAAVAVDEELSDAVYRLLETEPGFRRWSRGVRGAQRKLRRLASPAAWKAFLPIEEAVNERTNEEFRILVRWAFEEGLLFPPSGYHTA